MKPACLNFVIDCAAAFLLLGMLATGFILRFPLPPGTQRSHYLWGLSRHEWGTVHTWISFGLIAVLIVHVVLHWQWIDGMIRTRIGRRTRNGPPAESRTRMSGLVTAVVLLGAVAAFAWAACQSVQPVDMPDDPQRERLRRHGEVSDAAGLPQAGPNEDFVVYGQFPPGNCQILRG